MLDYLLILIPFWILAYAVYLYGVNRCEDKYVVIKCDENNEIKVYGNCDEEQNNCIEISEPEKIGNFENTELYDVMKNTVSEDGLCKEIDDKTGRWGKYYCEFGDLWYADDFFSEEGCSLEHDDRDMAVNVTEVTMQKQNIVDF